MNLEKRQLHWRQLGFDVHDDYLASIDPFGQVKEMVGLHENTEMETCCRIADAAGLGRGAGIERTRRGAGWESRYRNLAALAKATVRAPDLAKHRLNKTLLARLRKKRPGKGRDAPRISRTRTSGVLHGMQWQEDTYLWNLIAYLLSYRRIPPCYPILGVRLSYRTRGWVGVKERVPPHLRFPFTITNLLSQATRKYLTNVSLFGSEIPLK